MSLALINYRQAVALAPKRQNYHHFVQQLSRRRTDAIVEKLQLQHAQHISSENSADQLTGWQHSTTASDIKRLSDSGIKIWPSNYRQGYSMITIRHLVLACVTTCSLITVCSAMYDPAIGRFCSRDPIGYRGSKWSLLEYVDQNPLNKLDSHGKQGHKVTKCCGGKTYKDNAGNQNMYGCCNKQLFTLKDDCCENDTIVAKVPVWIATTPVFESPYARNICAGWDATMCPFNLVGWNYSHAAVCLDGPMEGCIGPLLDSDSIVDQTDFIVDSCALDPQDARFEKVMVCPAAKTRLRGLVGLPWEYNTLFNNCHHFIQGEGLPVW